MSGSTNTASERLRAAVSTRLSEVLPAPWQSLPVRIIVLVIGMVIMVSIAVAWVSANSIQKSLRDATDRDFPATLSRTSQRLDLWYQRRELDIQLIANASAIQRNIGKLGAADAADRDLAEIEQFLAYQLEESSMYRAMLLLDPDGEPLLSVGEPLGLPDEQRRLLRLVSAPRVGNVVRLGTDRVQLASAAIEDASSRRVASVHAAIDLAAVEAEVQRAKQGVGSVYVIADGGEILMRAPVGAPRLSYSRPLPLEGAMPAVEVYDYAAAGEVVGSAVRFDRFKWTIVVEQPTELLFAPARAIARKILLLDAGIALLCCLIAFPIARAIVKPIQVMSEAALRVKEGARDVIFPEHRTDEIGVLGRTFNEMVDRLQENRVQLEDNRVEIEDANSKLVTQNLELQRVNEIFHQLSITDDLTKLHNHRFFQDHLPREMKRAARTGEPLCLILIDIDDFKMLNDRYGHAVGDAVLRRTADVMHGVVREMDLLARYGGEEFALLASQTALEGATQLAEKLRLAVSEARFSVVTLEGQSQLSITVSVGVAPFRGDEKAFFNDADRALYRAKAAGKDCVVVAEDPETA